LANVPKQNAPSELPLKVDAVFLDVARRFVQTGQVTKDSYDAVLRDAMGRIVSRSPESDKLTELYRRLDASAKAGLTQGKPVVRDEPGPARVVPRREDRPPPPRPTGGGGGGGGG
jgi:hypothetical protein